jgi:hypothetical protein
VRDAVRGLQQRLREDELKVEPLRAHLKAGLDALERGGFTEIDDADLDATLDRLAAPAAPCFMPRYRLSDPAKTDIAAALRASESIYGADPGHSAAPVPRARAILLCMGLFSRFCIQAYSTPRAAP